MTTYLHGLLSRREITEAEYDALLPTGVTSAEELYAVTLHFPSLGHALPGGNLAKISSLSAQHSSLSFRHAAVARRGAPLIFANGANPPEKAQFQLGASSKPSVPKGFASPAPQTALARIDHHTRLRQAGWPVRDQGQRGTCVAHALTACQETLLFNKHSHTNVHPAEQFLFWGAKKFDPNFADGTTHAHALQAMQVYGWCDESAWPYNPLPGPTVHQGPPPPQALQFGGVNLHIGGTASTSNKASQLYAALLKSPVAIGVPVFADPLATTQDNWNVSALLEYGRVMDPQPQSVVTGGHAVCVVGFEPDPSELSGRGWFIIRNSWGVDEWGSKLPASGAYWGPEPGYGQISWSYVDSYLWEMCSLC